MKSTILLSAAMLIPNFVIAQTPEFQINTAGYRSLRMAIYALCEKTGWHIAYEEPVWPPKISGGPDARPTIDGIQVEPPQADRVQISIPTLRGSDGQAGGIAALLQAFNNQNSTVSYKMETLGDVTVLEADTMLDPTGSRVPAPLLLSKVIQIPTAQRTPLEHLEALTEAIQEQTGVPVKLDVGLGTWNSGFTGKNGPDTQRQDNLLNWGAQQQVARLALLDFLSRSKTTFTYQFACQVGINSPGECTLSLRPLTVEVVGRSGAVKKKTLYFDRGRPDMELPPDPPQ